MTEIFVIEFYRIGESSVRRRSDRSNRAGQGQATAPHSIYDRHCHVKDTHLMSLVGERLGVHVPF